VARERSTNRSLALKLWLKSGRERKLSDIADEIGVSAVMVRKWKLLDDWDNIPLKRAKGGQPGNKNAVGNSGGPGGPAGNDKAVKHGYYAKYLPEAVLEIVKEIEDSDPLEMLWNNIILLQAKLLHGQRIIHVNDTDDMTKEIKKTKIFQTEQMEEEQHEWEIQFAWDKFANASKSDVLMMREFRAAVKQFFAIAPENDERRLKLEAMQAQIDRIKVQTEKVQVEVKAAKGDKDEAVQIIDDIGSGSYAED